MTDAIVKEFQSLDEAVVAARIALMAAIEAGDEQTIIEASKVVASAIAHRKTEKHEYIESINGFPVNPNVEAIDTAKGDRWMMACGDSIQLIDAIPDNSIDFSMFSPPFPGMYVYSDLENDMGNCVNLQAGIEHFRYLMSANKMLRVIKPGREVAIHLQQPVIFKNRAGYKGLEDYRGDTIRMMKEMGWIHYGEVTVDKDPQALRDGSKVLTPIGWKTIDSLAVGDWVTGSDGKPTQVIGTYPFEERPMYRITFTDGGQVDCDAHHLWSVQTEGSRYSSGNWQTLQTKELFDQGWVNPSGRLRYEIPKVEPVEFLPSDDPLPVEPYLLGVLIGDGGLTARSSISFCVEHEIADSLKLPGSCKLRRQEGRDYADGNVGVYHLISSNGNNKVLTGLHQLGLHGKRAWEKSVPTEYLFGSVETRKSILQGLLDTDGTIKKNNSIIYCTTSAKLADDVTFLVRSLGGLTSLRVDDSRTYQYNDECRIGRPQYLVTIRLTLDWCPFRLSNKAARWSLTTRTVRRKIANIEIVDSSTCTCIEVAAKDSLFVTEDFIVTHNCQATRNKDQCLQFRSLCTDSSVLRPAIADYVLFFKKPGENQVPIKAGASEKYSTQESGWITEEEWIEWAAPVWYRSVSQNGNIAASQPGYPALHVNALQTGFNGKTLNGISETNTLNVEQARSADDQRHLCGLQLCLIERCIKLKTNPREIVFSPFAGIGSEIYQAIKFNRRAIGIELKKTYFNQAVKNIKLIDNNEQLNLLDLLLPQAG